MFIKTVDLKKIKIPSVNYCYYNNNKQKYGDLRVCHTCMANVLSMSYKQTKFKFSETNLVLLSLILDKILIG